MNIAQAIAYLYPSASPLDDFRIAVENGEQRIEYWGLSTPIPTDEELQVAWEAYQAQMAATAYKAKRAAEYPGIGEQLDALFKAGLMPKDIAAQIQAVKDKYPKSK